MRSLFAYYITLRCNFMHEIQPRKYCGNRVDCDSWNCNTHTHTIHTHTQFVYRRAPVVAAATVAGDAFVAQTTCATCHTADLPSRGVM